MLGALSAASGQGGLVAAWNEKQEMPNRICAGDFIFQVDLGRVGSWAHACLDESCQVNHVSSNPVAMIEDRVGLCESRPQAGLSTFLVKLLESWHPRVVRS